MIIISDFDQVFSHNPNYVYSQQLCREINEHRRKFDNKLFFDRLVETLSVKVVNLYPPHSNRDLRTLHDHIISAPIPDHHKQSLLFYILKDCTHRNDIDAASKFARECCLPSKYSTYVEGLWMLDRQQFQAAVELLTHPSLIPTFPDEILYTLLEYNDQDKSLALAYYHAVQPPLSTRDATVKYVKYLADISITEALFFVRQRSSGYQKDLIETLCYEALQSSVGDSRADRGLELVGLPFTEAEEACFEEYLLVGGGKSLHGARDTVMMRKILTGKLDDALVCGKHLSGRKFDGMTWDRVKDAMKQGMGPRIGAPTPKYF